MLDRQQPPRDIATLLKVARLTNNSDLSAALIEIAAEMTSRGLASSGPGAALSQQMSKAIELIVDGYVRLNDRNALDDLKAQREQLAAHLKATNARLDHGATIRQIEDELAVIEAGLARLSQTENPSDARRMVRRT